MTWAVIIAVVGALAIAAGAALQERAAVSAPFGISQLRLFRHLMRSRRWVLGLGLTGLGIGAHMLALVHAPLILVQPIQTTGLLFAVMLAAFFGKRRLTSAQIGGCLAVTVGLVALITALPMHAGNPVLTPTETALMPLVCVGGMLMCVLVARFGGASTRAWTFALAGGIGFAVTSALARFIGVGMLDNPMAAMRPLTVIAVVIGLCGGMIVQNAYRTGHFTLAYATLMISDPLSAAILGVVFFGEQLPADPLHSAIAIIGAVVCAAGVITLSRATHAKGRATGGAAVDTSSPGPPPATGPQATVTAVVIDTEPAGTPVAEEDTPPRPSAAGTAA
ncbi:drug/metabolite transporter (DMT)-like permease [Nocardiopsis mwathae]|uniref:Drug/metabolite transporter (DMT)-like permease n=1 Tax=Nocardiopsis mwathae TaxID=1472723 RepID=A0A7W9YKF3_9ACTN|nr:DMT family transporter [Nocardiopsis mwathae]MBB6173595.1 drug/metabolite transporter (DMT)-like permease [Nocardiopsis mwathae]